MILAAIRAGLLRCRDQPGMAFRRIMTRESTMSFIRRTALATPLLLLPLVTGCGPGEGGLTQGPPPEDRTSAGARTDLPVPTPADQGEILGETGDNSTDAGTGGKGGGTAGNPPAEVK
jgi:hypothetical protein